MPRKIELPIPSAIPNEGQLSNMTVVETVKSDVGLSDGPPRKSSSVQCLAVALSKESPRGYEQ
jgi:hypothetical protein